MSTINDRIREAILSDGRTQSEIARACGVQRATVNDWVQGRTKYVRPEHLFALADALRISPRWLATGDGAKIDHMANPNIRRMVNAASKTSPVIQSKLADMATSIAEERAEYRV